MNTEATPNLSELGQQQGQVIDVFAILRRCERREAKNGKPYWNLTLADQEATVPHCAS